MIAEYLDPKISFHGKEPRVDENGIKHYFLGLKTVEPERAAKQLGISGKEGVIKAIHYKNVDHEDLMDKGLLNRDYAVPRLKEKPRVVAIHLTHTMALRHFINSDDGAKWAFIFEEDIKLPKGGKKAREYSIQYLKDAEKAISMDQPQLHYIGHCFTGQGGKKIRGDVFKKTSDEDRPRCRHAYVVNKAGAKKLMEASWPMKNNGDEMWANLDFVYFSDNDGYFIQDWLLNEKKGLRKPLKKFVEKQIVQRSNGKEVPLYAVIIVYTISVGLLPLALFAFKNKGRGYGQYTWIGLLLAGLLSTILVSTVWLEF